MAVKAVVFDVGETLLDETGIWEEVAQLLGVPTFTLFALVGTTIARDESQRRAFELLGRGRPEGLVRNGASLYGDALPCLERLRERGYSVGIVGNQPAFVTATLRELGCEADFIATSAEWGVEKPAPEFFARVVEATGREPAEIAYVGDRIDNDVLPAQAAGMLGVFLRRGPWGYFQGPGSAVADVRIDSLDELPEALA